MRVASALEAGEEMKRGGVEVGAGVGSKVRGGRGDGTGNRLIVVFPRNVGTPLQGIAKPSRDLVTGLAFKKMEGSGHGLTCGDSVWESDANASDLFVSQLRFS